jgi:hypothetical protein
MDLTDDDRRVSLCYTGTWDAPTCYYQDPYVVKDADVLIVQKVPMATAYTPISKMLNRSWRTSSIRQFNEAESNSPFICFGEDKS